MTEDRRTKRVPVDVICRNFNGQVISRDHTVKVTDQASGRSIEAIKDKDGLWTFQIPETGVSMLLVEAWGTDSAGGFFPTRVFLTIDSAGRVAVVPRKGDSSFVDLVSDPQTGRFTLKMILGRLRERPLVDFSGDTRKRIHILKDTNQVENTWVLEYVDADLITTSVLFEVKVNTKPKWIAVSFPSQWKAFDRMLVYFHPEPSQNKDHVKMVAAHGYPDGLANLVRGYLGTVGNRVNLAFQLSASGRQTMLVLPVL